MAEQAGDRRFPEEDAPHGTDPHTLPFGLSQSLGGLRDEARRKRRIGIHHQHRVLVGRGGEQAVEELVGGAALLTDVAHGFHDGRIVGCGDPAGLIGAAISDDYDLIGDPRLGGQRFEGSGKFLLLVVSRRDDHDSAWARIGRIRSIAGVGEAVGHASPSTVRSASDIPRKDQPNDPSGWCPPPTPPR